MTRWCLTAAAIPILLCAAALAGCGERSAGGGQPASADVAEPSRGPGEGAAADLVERAGLPACPVAADVPAISGGLPHRTLDCLGGGPKVTLSGVRGRPAVVNVWASWCPPCAKEMPLLVESRKAAGNRVLFLGIDIENTREQGLAWAHDLHMNFPSVLDPDGDVKQQLRLLGPPVTFFVRADGTIAYTHQGPLASTGQIADLVREHLGVGL
jgi:cytochrome c biogenesis protein CcmG/thiol:disulfide interchange protein DsbE